MSSFFATSIEGDVLLEFDSTPRERHSGRAEPTDNPVEDGGVVSDHVVDVPDEVEIQGMISNRPILALASERARSVLGGTIEERAADAYELIRRFRKARALVQVATELREYEDMLILSEDVTRDRNTGKILDITVRLREFRTATVQTVASPEPIDPVDKPAPDLGPKQTAPAAAPVAEKSGGIFTRIAGGAQALQAGLAP